MNAKEAHQRLKDCCPGEWTCSNCRGPKIYLAALAGPEVKALVEGLEQIAADVEFTRMRKVWYVEHAKRILAAFRGAVEP